MKELFVIAALVLLGSSPANAYEIGTLTCQRIGELAAEALAAKQTGTELDVQLSKVTAPLDIEAAQERKLVTNIVTLIYQNDLLVAMKPVDAYLVFRSDCMRGRGGADG